jgi:hypothetical protein
MTSARLSTPRLRMSAPFFAFSSRSRVALGRNSHSTSNAPNSLKTLGRQPLYPERPVSTKAPNFAFFPASSDSSACGPCHFSDIRFGRRGTAKDPRSGKQSRSGKIIPALVRSSIKSVRGGAAV